MRKLSQKELNTVAGAAPSSIQFSFRVPAGGGGNARFARGGNGQAFVTSTIGGQTFNRSSNSVPFSFSFGR